VKPQRIADYADLRLAIRARRQQLGLSLDQLAQITGVSASKLLNIEGGGVCLRPATYGPILSALGLQIVVREAAS
jgi:predicted transcriptional regulator